MIRVLFVCLGNICRSPAAEAIFENFATKRKLEVHVESCAIGDWHIGQLADERMRRASQSRGVILMKRAKQFTKELFESFDLILAADNKILTELYLLAEKPEFKAKVHLITKYSRAYPNEQVPDPYFGGEAGFELVLDILEDACDGLLNELQK